MRSQEDSSTKACARRLFSVCFSGRVSLCGKQAGASRMEGKEGANSHLRVPWRDQGTGSSQVQHASLHGEAFNGAENLPSAPENPPRNSLFQSLRQPVCPRRFFQPQFFFPPFSLFITHVRVCLNRCSYKGRHTLMQRLRPKDTQRVGGLE